MAGEGVVGKVKKDHLKPKSRSARAGLVLPVGRVRRIMRDGNYGRRLAVDAVVYLTAVLQYLSTEVLELAATAAEDNGRSRISPRHIMLAVRYDDELDRLLQGVLISQGGIMPHINSFLLPKKTKKTGPDTSSQEY